MNKMILLVALNLVAIGHALAKENYVDLEGNYSNIELTQVESDLIGYRIIIVDSLQGYKGIFQSAEGRPSVPQVVDIEVNGRKIRFDVRGSFSATFIGTISEKDIRGNFYKNGSVVFDKDVVVLKREPDYRECKCRKSTQIE